MDALMLRELLHFFKYNNCKKERFYVPLLPSQTSPHQSLLSFGIGNYYITAGRRAGEEEMIEIRMVSGETTLILHKETYQL